MVKITQRALLSALEGAKNLYPREFLCLLRENKEGTITEIVLAPLMASNNVEASFNDWNLPFDQSIVGTFHSHPTSGMPRPSSQDLKLFSSKGRVHLIAGLPFGMESVRAFTNKGKDESIEIVA